MLGDGTKGAQIGSQGDEVGDSEQGRRQDQRGVILWREEEWHDQEDERADHQVQAGAEHKVHLAYIVGGACHRIAHRLEAVKGHAFAKQGDIQLVAHVALDLLRHQFRTEVAPQLQDGADDLRAAHDERQREQDFRIRRCLQHGVEGVAGQHRHVGGQRRITDGAHRHDDHQPPVAQGVRDHPAQRAAPVRVVLSGEREFGELRSDCHNGGFSRNRSRSDCRLAPACRRCSRHACTCASAGERWQSDLQFARIVQIVR